jgi:hypothetical protein
LRIYIPEQNAQSGRRARTPSHDTTGAATAAARIAGDQ